MSAEKMFNKLGYDNLLSFDDNKIYYKNNDDFIICFDKNKECFECYVIDIFTEDEISIPIPVNLLQAINKQVKELGWNK